MGRVTIMTHCRHCAFFGIKLEISLRKEYDIACRLFPFYLANPSNGIVGLTLPSQRYAVFMVVKKSLAWFTWNVPEIFELPQASNPKRTEWTRMLRKHAKDLKLKVTSENSPRWYIAKTNFWG